jgi:hypothetical protein
MDIDRFFDALSGSAYLPFELHFSPAFTDPTALIRLDFSIS